MSGKKDFDVAKVARTLVEGATITGVIVVILAIILSTATVGAAVCVMVVWGVVWAIAFYQLFHVEKPSFLDKYLLKLSENEEEDTDEGGETDAERV
jgi:hypothetical protein